MELKVKAIGWFCKACDPPVMRTVSRTSEDTKNKASTEEKQETSKSWKKHWKVFEQANLNKLFSNLQGNTSSIGPKNDHIKQVSKN